MKAKEYYNAAIYLRLSRDDGESGGAPMGESSGDTSVLSGEHMPYGRKVESNSIGSQRDMICSYIKEQANMKIYDIYADDGFSGANFDRPEFKRMMQDIEAGNVNCVIVKDLSRLGRDYIEAGRLIQKTFPAFSVRFIALTDHFDSLTADYNETSLVVPVKNFVNDSYSRDISGKVRSHQKIKREKGDFIGAFAMFGYQKSSDNRNHLVPDEYAANIVKKIFAWKIEGYSNRAIAELLDGLGILSPLEYRKIRGENFRMNLAAGVKAKWSSVAVKRILTDENYTGTLVQGKHQKVNYKVKKSVWRPEKEWTKVPGTHEAIISKEDFGVVQDLLKIDVRPKGGERKAHMYAGLLFCGDCMQPMTRRLNRYKGKETVSFICPTKNHGGVCSRHSISEGDLEHLILTALKQQISLFLNKSRVLESVNRIEIKFDEAAAFDKETEKLRREQDKYLTLGAGLHEDLRKQIITEEDFENFREIYEERYKELQETVSRREETKKKLFRAGVAAGINLERMKNAMQITELDRLTLVTFVKRILVYEDKRIYLELRHQDLFSKEGAV